MSFSYSISVAESPSNEMEQNLRNLLEKTSDNILKLKPTGLVKGLGNNPLLKEISVKEDIQWIRAIFYIYNFLLGLGGMLRTETMGIGIVEPV